MLPNPLELNRLYAAVLTIRKRSGIRSDPSRADDEEYIVRLVGQVVRVSLETVRVP